MLKRKLNWKLAIVLVIAATIFCVGSYNLWRWQRQRVAAYEINQGDLCYQSYDWSTAVYHYGRYLALTERDVPVMLRYAGSYLNMRPLKTSYVDGAVAVYRDILRTNPENEQATERLVRLYLEIEMPGEIEFVLSRFPAIDESPQMKRILAMALLEQRKHKEAVRLLTETIDRGPNFIGAYETMSNVLEQYQYSYSLSDPLYWLDKAVENNPELAAAYIARGCYHLRNSNTESALADFAVAEKLDITDPLVRLRLARSYLGSLAYDKAKEHLLTLQRAIPTNQSLWESWARLALETGSSEMMISVAEEGLKALTHQPWDFMLLAAELLLEADRVDMAEPLISELRCRQIAPARLEYLQGLLAEHHGKNYKAISYWNRAVQLGAEKTKARFKMIDLYCRLGDKSSAIKQLRMLIADKPKSVKARLNLVRLLINTGQVEEAVRQARETKLMAPEVTEAELLHIYVRMQKYARQHLKSNHQAWQKLRSDIDELENKIGPNIKIDELKVCYAMQLSQWEQAQQLIQQLLKRHGQTLEIDILQAQLLMTLGRAEEARTLLLGTMNRNLDSTEPLRLLILLAGQEGDVQWCEQILAEALERTQSLEQQREVLVLLSGVYEQTGQPQKRYSLLTAWLEKMQGDVSLMCELSETLMEMGRFKDAQNIVEQIRDIEGDRGWRWRFEQARLWLVSDEFNVRYQQVVALLRENLRSNADNQLSRIALAQAYYRRGQLKLAVMTCKDVLSRMSSDIEVVAPAIGILYYTREYKYADRVISKIAASTAWSSLGNKITIRHLIQQGQIETAWQIVDKFLTDADRLQEDDTGIKILRVPRRDRICRALFVCNELVDKFSNAAAHIIRARTYATLDRTGKAIEDFDRAVELEPDNIQARLARALFYRKLKEERLAADDIETAISLGELKTSIKLTASSILLHSNSQDHIARGEHILEELFAANPDDAQLHLCHVRYLIRQGTKLSIEQARTILEKLTLAEKPLPQVWAMLAQIMLLESDKAGADEAVRKGLGYAPKDKSLLALKALIESRRLPAVAIETLEMIYRLYPDDVSAVIDLADAYIAEGRNEISVRFLQKCSAAMKCKPGSRQIDLKLAVALYKSGRTGQAEELFGQLSHGPVGIMETTLTKAEFLISEENWTHLGDLIRSRQAIHKITDITIVIARKLAATGNPAARRMAEKLLRQVIENKSDNIEAMYLLAQQYYTSSTISKSIELYERIIEQRPDDPVAANNLSWILCEQQRQYNRALEIAERGIMSNPDFADLINTRGMIFYRMNKYERAAIDLESSVQSSRVGSHSALMSHFLLGKTLAKLGRAEPAVQNLNEALILNENIGGLSGDDISEIRNLIDSLSSGV